MCRSEPLHPDWAATKASHATQSVWIRSNVAGRGRPASRRSRGDRCPIRRRRSTCVATRVATLVSRTFALDAVVDLGVHLRIDDGERIDLVGDTTTENRIGALGVGPGLHRTSDRDQEK